MTPATVAIPVYRGNPATSVALFINYENGRYIFTAEAVGNFCSASWTGVDSSNGLTAWKAPADCNNDISVSVTLNPQGVTALYEHSKQYGNIAVSGNNAAGVGSQYTASNAIAPVTWMISSGSIDSVTGIITKVTCGTATVTAIDKCGRTGSLDVRFPSGMWVSDNNKCCINFAQIPKELQKYVYCNEYQCYGASRIVGGTRETYYSWPGWGWTYAGVCNNCGPSSTYTKATEHWECP